MGKRSKRKTLRTRIGCNSCKSQDIIMISNPEEMTRPYKSQDIMISNPERMTRPEFICGSCTNTWTNGKTGGKYTQYCREKEANKKKHERGFIFETRTDYNSAIKPGFEEDKKPETLPTYFIKIKNLGFPEENG